MPDAIFLQPLEEVTLASIDQSEVTEFVGAGEEFPDEFYSFFALPFVEATSFLSYALAIVPWKKLRSRLTSPWTTYWKAFIIDIALCPWRMLCGVAPSSVTIYMRNHSTVALLQFLVPVFSKAERAWATTVASSS